MKLSEAIRLGAMHGPQIFGSEFSQDGSQGTCALGAAIIAIGAKGVPCKFPDPNNNARQQREGVPMLVVTLPWHILSVEQHCPDCFWKIARPIHRLIAHLNDHHRWTRQEIADWVETIEQEESAARLDIEPRQNDNSDSQLTAREPEVIENKVVAS